MHPAFVVVIATVIFLICIINSAAVFANLLRSGIVDKLSEGATASKDLCDACHPLVQDCGNDDYFCDAGCMDFSGCGTICNKCVEKFEPNEQCFSSLECKSGYCVELGLIVGYCT